MSSRRTDDTSEKRKRSAKQTAKMMATLQVRRASGVPSFIKDLICDIVKGNLGCAGRLNSAFMPRTIKEILLSSNGDDSPTSAQCQFTGADPVSSTATDFLPDIQETS
jgi:hypothetical protein